MTEKIIINSGGDSLEIIPENAPIADMRAQAIETTIQLLDAEDVAYIIYIDDKFDINSQKEEFVGRIKKLKAENQLIKKEIFDGFNWDGPDALITKFWNDSINKSELLYEVFTHIRDEDSANVIPALEIEKCFGDRIKLKTPDQWFSDKYQLLKDLDGGKKALCLFDYEFQSGNKLIEGRNGAELAKLLIDKEEYTDRIVCGIFSHKFTEEEEEDYRTKYSNDYDIEKKKFYTISKFRFAFDPQITGFAEGIKNLLLHPYIEQLKNESLEVLSESHIKAKRRIEDITPKTFNQIIQKSSLNEGVWEINTLFRLYGILSKEENLNFISDSTVRQRFNDSIKRIRHIDEHETGYFSKVVNRQIIDLRDSELYLKGDIINKLHLPVSNGDIFSIKDKPYILLVQLCNLAIRAKGRECGVRSKNYNNAFLIPLREFSKEQLNHTKQEVLSPTNTLEKTLCAYFAEFKVFSLDYLDLTVFNEKGKSFLDMKEPELENDVIHFPWKKRYKYIYENLIKIERRIQSYLHIESLISPRIEEINKDIRGLTKDFKNLKKVEREQILGKMKPMKSEKEGLENHLETLKKNIHSIESFENFSLNDASNYDIDTRIFSFEIKRIKHYKSPYSDDLLQNFMLYLSRNAFEHDFMN